MQNVKNSRNRWFAISLALSIAFVLGVIGIPLFATSKQTALMIVCIVFTVIGFYCMPLCWIVFASRCSTIRVGRVILNEEIYHAKELETRLKININDVEKHIDKLLYWQALPNLKYDPNQMLLLNAQQQKQQQKWMQKCTACGAKVEGVGAKTICPYCGWAIDKNV